MYRTKDKSSGIFRIFLRGILRLSPRGQTNCQLASLTPKSTPESTLPVLHIPQIVEYSLEDLTAGISQALDWAAEELEGASGPHTGEIFLSVIRVLGGFRGDLRGLLQEMGVGVQGQKGARLAGAGIGRWEVRLRANEEMTAGTWRVVVEDPTGVNPSVEVTFGDYWGFFRGFFRAFFGFFRG